MTIDIKTDKEIEIMKEGGSRLRAVVAALLKTIEAGMTTKKIDETAERLIIEAGGQPSFKKVKGYFWTTCVPINDQVVHTPPSDRRLKQGDLLTVDIGMYYKGYHTDFATTFVVDGKEEGEVKKFLDTGRLALKKAISVAKAGKKLGLVSEAIEKEVYGNGYFILKDLTGHGIGKTLHEEPYVFGFMERPVENTITMKPGLTIAIEVIYSTGTEEIAYERDNKWSITTKDRSLSACFEHTVAVTEKNSLVLT